MIEIYNETRARGSSNIKASNIERPLEGPGLVVKTSNQASTTNTINSIPDVKLVQMDFRTARTAVKPKSIISKISKPTHVISQL